MFFCRQENIALILRYHDILSWACAPSYFYSRFFVLRHILRYTLLVSYFWLLWSNCLRFNFLNTTTTCNCIKRTGFNQYFFFQITQTSSRFDRDNFTEFKKRNKIFLWKWISAHHVFVNYKVSWNSFWVALAKNMLKYGGQSF